MPSYIDRVVRRHLPADQLTAAVNVLVTMLEAPEGRIKVYYETESGAVEAAMPPAAFDLLLDALSLLASRGRATVLALDEDQEVSAEDWARIIGVSARWSGALLKDGSVAPNRSDNKTDWYPLADLIEAYRFEDDEASDRPARRRRNHGSD